MDGDMQEIFDIKPNSSYGQIIFFPIYGAEVVLYTMGTRTSGSIMHVIGQSVEAGAERPPSIKYS